MTFKSFSLLTEDQSLEEKVTETKDEDVKLSELKSEFIKQRDKLDKMALKAAVKKKSASSSERLKLRRKSMMNTKRIKSMLDQKLTKPSKLFSLL